MAATAVHLKWFNPVHIEWGEGLLETFESDTPFFVLADPGAISLPMEMNLKMAWGPRCLQWLWQRAPQSSLDAAHGLCVQLWPLWERTPDAALLAIGGGTTMDLAKIARFKLPQLDDAVKVWRSNQLPPAYQRQRLWCAPTTSGTGSEVTPWATLWDMNMTPPLKRSWSSPLGFADQALIDPTLTLPCSQSLTRDTALDTLAHALESLWNHNANDLTRPLAVQAAQIVLESLPALLLRPQDMGLRNLMSKASLLAGLAMSQTQTALAHALSYDLTLHEKLPHGHVCAVWLPMVMDLAVERHVHVRQDLALVFGCAPPQAIQKLRAWLLDLGIEPRDLRDSAEGREQLLLALSSARGRNFIGSNI